MAKFLILSLLPLVLLAGCIVTEPGNTPSKTSDTQSPLRSVPVDGNYIAITFDDGPHPVNTPKILDILKEYDVKATFFSLGKNVLRHKKIAQRIVAEGHEIQNHSWSHRDYSKLNSEEIRADLEETSKVIKEITGKEPHLFRPPYGKLADGQGEWISRELGYRLVYWSIDPKDWKRPGSEVITTRVVSNAQKGAILLLHDIHEDTTEAMPEILGHLKRLGFKFITVSRLAAMAKSSPLSAPSTPAVNR